MIASGALKRATVLIVDDEPANLSLARAYLDSSYELLEASDGPSALALVDSQPVDLVLLDVMMPNMSGFEVCRRIKRGREQYLPVILLTALDRQEQRNVGLEAGADDFMSKPVDRRELTLRVERLIKIKRHEEQIREQLDLVSRHDQMAQKQIRELQELDVLKEDLVAMMVHDLRNPLAGIVGFLDLLTSDLDDHRLRKDADAAVQAGNRLREILDDMLHVRMLEGGALHMQCELVQAGAVVEDAIKSVWGAARARRVEIAAQIEQSLLQLDADPKYVRRAIENLLSNAVKYSPSGTSVRASVRAVGSDVEIEVADRGSGIPEQFKEHLFQKFGSIEAARGDARNGIGLGLYLVKLVANAHGGRAVVRDRKHGGAAFGLVLPRASPFPG
jgi:signal transduction histidine kinase